MSKIELYLSKIIKYGLYAILLTPLAFWPKALFPFLTPKFISFQILVEIVFGAWLILKLIGLRNQSVFRKNYITVALSLFISISFISALLGVDFSRSFWGIGPRMTSMFAELHFLAWFLVLASFLKNKEEWNRYLNFSFIVAIAVALTSFYQDSAWGLSFGYGIFNNPTFVAPYLIFHFFWGLYRTFCPTSNVGWKRWFFGIGTALILFVIIFVQIRGAILGLLAGVAILGFGLIFTNILSRRFRILFSVLYFLFFIILTGLWQLRDNEYIQGFSPIKRVTGISLFETSVQTRLLAWKVALKGYKDAPWFGVGSENFNYVFNKNYDPKFLKFGGGGFGETWFDKPHNAFLQILDERGTAGILAYVLIWIAAGLSLYKLFKQGEKFLFIALAGAFTAYLGTVFFSFDSFGSLFGLYLFLAFLASQNYDINNTSKKNINISFVSLVIISILASLLYLNYSIWRANIADADALRIFPRNAKQGISLFKKSLNYFTPYKSEYRLDLFTAVGSAIQVNYLLPNPEETINFVLAEGDKIISDHPNDAAYYTNFVKLYDILGENSRDPQILKIAQSYGEKSLELSPNRQETLFYLTKNALLENDAKSAVAFTTKAVEVDPSINSSHWYFGLALIADGRQEKGITEIKKAFELGYKPQNQLEKDFIKNLGL